jgi:hypothetical protein
MDIEISGEGVRVNREAAIEQWLDLQLSAEGSNLSRQVEELARVVGISRK